MLIKKMFRDMKKNWFPFVSILILSYLALFLYTGMSCSNIGIRQLRSEYHKETNLADIWIYGMDMTDDICGKIDSISDVDDSQLRMKLTAESTEGYQIDLYAEKENNITVPYNMDGADFDAGAQQGIWLNSRYAKAHDINVGDMFTIKWNGIEISQEIKGFIMSPEYEYYKAPEDVEPDFSHMGYAYMSYDSLKEILGDTMPSYNQIVVTIGNANASEVENDITAAIDDNYSQIFDQSNFNGLTAFDSELSQHDMFAYAFPIIFILIAILTIITTMGRIINNQRTQIGTMKALGIKRHKIIIHYIMFSLVVSAVGCIVGVITGPIVMGPVFNDFMPESYSMPKWGYSYSIKFYIVALAIVVICAFASYINCRKLINLNTVEILYARAPKDAKNCLFEKLPFWKRFKFTTKYNLRDMARAKIRSIIVVIGIGCGTILILCALGCNDTMDGMKSWMFDDLMKYDSSIRISTLTPKEEYTKIAEDEDGELLMSSSVEVRSDNGKETAKTGLTVPQSDKLYTITDTNRNISIRFRNRELERNATIIKIDSITKQPVAGATLVVKDSEGKVIEEFVTTTEPHKLTDLEDGTYTVEETKAPAGYEKTDEIYEFTVDKDHRDVTVTIENTPIEKLVNILKVDAATGNPLAGATLVVKDSEGNVIEEFVTTEEPHTITGLKDGEYTVEETKAPEGYKKSDEIYKFTISDETPTALVIFENNEIVEVPFTGSNKSLISTLFGSVLLISGVGFVYYNGKKQKVK